MHCKESISLMHEYLDGDLYGARLADLNQHVMTCNTCKAHMKQLERTDVFMGSWTTPSLPDNLTQRVMHVLPEEQKQSRWIRLVKNHPAVSAAMFFFVIMLSSFLSLWNSDTELMVKGTDLEQVVIKGNQVTVPEGRTVKGDLIVENGEIQVFGNVTGNLVVIDGSYNLSSTALIAGEINHIDEALDWLWYKLKDWFNS
jgi:anti-sigma factor RsiW